MCINVELKQCAGIPELVRIDNAVSCLREVPVFHAILCDPPYGVRAGARKSGRKGGARSIPEEKRDGHIPATQVYDTVDVCADANVLRWVISCSR